MTQRTWICNGEPKDGKDYPHCGLHEPYENYGPDCVICGLPKEAMIPQTKQRSQKTVLSGSKSKSPLIPVAIAVAVLLALGAGFGLYKVNQARRSNDPPVDLQALAVDPQAIASTNAVNAGLISQGEKILFPGSNSQKTAGAAAFAQKDWNNAIAQFQQAATAQPNDPETKIYLNNAKAKQAGNPLTMAVTVPIAPDANTAKEVLRGVALAQDRFNSSPPQPGRLLEVVIANEENSTIATSLAQDLIKYPNVLGILGQGVDNNSRQAIALYQQAGLAVLSPISTSVTSSNNGQSTLKTIPIAQKANELLGTYLQSSAKELAEYANNQQTPAKVVVFYNSDSPYSQQLKNQFTAALSQVQGEVVKEVDITNSSFNAATELANAKKGGAKIAFLALSKNKVDSAVAIAKANASTLILMASDDLYSPTLLTKGGDAIKDIVLAVPWSSQSDDPFAQQATSIWKGRISWRTATAYDATQTLAAAFNQSSTRSGVDQMFNQGIPVLSGTATNFNLFNDVPLVKAVKGSQGPRGSKYQFDPI